MFETNGKSKKKKKSKCEWTTENKSSIIFSYDVKYNVCKTHTQKKNQLKIITHKNASQKIKTEKINYFRKNVLNWFQDCSKSIFMWMFLSKSLHSLNKYYTQIHMEMG